MLLVIFYASYIKLTIVRIPCQYIFVNMIIMEKFSRKRISVDKRNKRMKCDEKNLDKKI